MREIHVQTFSKQNTNNDVNNKYLSTLMKAVLCADEDPSREGMFWCTIMFPFVLNNNLNRKMVLEDCVRHVYVCYHV